jgi:pimeloyl-ACP methyl ester carboxylesterase
MNAVYQIPVLFALVGIGIAWLAIRRLLSLRRRSYSGWRKATEGVVLLLLAVASALMAASSGFNAAALYRFRHAPPGQTFLVDGHTMRIECSGSGSPTIILDAGLGNDGLIWGGVQPVLAKTTRVCSYDRAGFGWSDTLSPPRDADHIAVELHGLLAAAQITGPVVLMGHSISGIYIRDYATRYPENVAGLIFVDGSTPLQNRNRLFKPHPDPAPSRLGALWKKATIAAGIPRLLGACSRPLPGFGAQAARLQAEDQCHDRSAAVAAELGSFDRSGEETVHTGPYGTLPILILSQDPAHTAVQGQPVAVVKEWNQMQEDLKLLSTRSRRIIAKGSSHYIHGDRPDLIEKEVPIFIQQIRGATPEPTDYGSTETK